MPNLTAIQTVENPIDSVLKEIRDTSLEGHLWNIRTYKKLMNAFWNTPDVDPQDICDRLGTKAAKMFILGGMLRDLILEEDPDALPDELLYPVRLPTINPDGTVTLAPLQDEVT